MASNKKSTDQTKINADLKKTKSAPKSKKATVKKTAAAPTKAAPTKKVNLKKDQKVSEKDKPTPSADAPKSAPQNDPPKSSWGDAHRRRQRDDEADLAFGAFLGHAQAGLDEAKAAAIAGGRVLKFAFADAKEQAAKDFQVIKEEGKKFVEKNPALSVAIATVASSAVVASLVSAFRRKK